MIVVESICFAILGIFSVYATGFWLRRGWEAGAPPKESVEENPANT